MSTNCGAGCSDATGQLSRQSAALGEEEQRRSFLHTFSLWLCPQVGQGFALRRPTTRSAFRLDRGIKPMIDFGPAGFSRRLGMPSPRQAAESRGIGQKRRRLTTSERVRFRRNSREPWRSCGGPLPQLVRLSHFPIPDLRSRPFTTRVTLVQKVHVDESRLRVK